MKLHLRDILWLIAIVAIGCVLYQQTAELRSLRASLSEQERQCATLEQSLKQVTKERDFRQEMAMALEASLIAKGHSASMTRDNVNGRLRVVDFSQSSE